MKMTVDAGSLVMAYLVVAYLVMAYLVMAHLVMAYLVMAYPVMAYLQVVRGEDDGGRRLALCECQQVLRQHRCLDRVLLRHRLVEQDVPCAITNMP